MANASAKKILKQNEQMLKRAMALMVAFLIVYIGMRFVFWYSSTTKGHWFGLFVVLISNAAGFAMLYYSGRSTKTETGEVLASDTDLNAKGLIEYWWDLLYITWFVQIATLISDWFWLAYLVVPGFIIYQLWVNIVAPSLTSNTGVGAPTESAKDRKRREKVEKKQQKVKIQRAH